LVASLRVSKWRPIGRTRSGHPAFYLMPHCGGGCPRYAGIAIPPIPFRAILERDELWLDRHPTLAFCLSMIFSENRYPLFLIML
jgi:hypothetical protein